MVLRGDIVDKSKAISLLNSNISKTMGCTDIGVVGYIASIGAYTLRNEKIKSVHLIMSEELYKNSVNVGVPGLHESGLDKALALGILLKNPTKQLAVFESVTRDEIDKIASLLNEIDVTIEHKKFDDTRLYEELLVAGSGLRSGAGSGTGAGGTGTGSGTGGTKTDVADTKGGTKPDGTGPASTNNNPADSPDSPCAK